MSEPLHTATIVLQEEAQAGREEGDSPVGEQAGAQVEVLTVHKARTIPEIAAAESADLVYRELPFAVPVGEGTLATGRNDLAYRKAGEWTVIDFRTADLPDPAAALQAHGPQMAVYREALAKITGKEARAALCLIRSGQLLDLGQRV